MAYPITTKTNPRIFIQVGYTPDHPKRWSNPAKITKGKDLRTPFNGASTLSHGFVSGAFPNPVCSCSASNPGCCFSAHIHPPRPPVMIDTEKAHACHQPKPPAQTNGISGMIRYSVMMRNHCKKVNELSVLGYSSLDPMRYLQKMDSYVRSRVARKFERIPGSGDLFA